MTATNESTAAESGQQLRVGLVVFEEPERISGHRRYIRSLAAALGELGASIVWVPIETKGYGLDIIEGFGMDVAESLALHRVDVFLVDEACHAALRRWSRRMRPPSRMPRQVAIVQELKSAAPGLAPTFFWPFELRFLGTMDGCVFAGRRAQAQVDRMLGRRPNSILAPPGGDHLEAKISDERITSRASDPSSLRLLFLGHVTPEKGLHHLLAALERWPSGAWQLEVAGSLELAPKYAALMQARVNAANLGERVNFQGVVQDELLLRLLSRSHAMVMPGVNRGIGLAYLEAMGFGLPVIAAQNGPAVDMVTDGVDGYLVKPEDPQSILGALQPWARDRNSLLRMSLAARRRYVAQPSWRATASQLLPWLSSISGLRG